MGKPGSKNTAPGIDGFFLSTVEAALHLGNYKVKVISKCVPRPESTPPENLHIVGLFHDCGVPAMTIRYSDYVNTQIMADRDEGRTIIEFEEERYRCNHAVIGYYIAVSWGLPEELCKIILRHHDTDALGHRDVTPEFRQIYSCLKLACHIVEKGSVPLGYVEKLALAFFLI